MNKLRFEERNLIQLENEINKKIEKEREDYGEEEES
jgi:hypothetical protein